jgi:mannose-6-phosphate isomerase-like protein (cupin superfamily)
MECRHTHEGALHMRKPIYKRIADIPIEAAHDGSGSRQLLLSSSEEVSTQFEAATKGYLKPGFCFDWHQHNGVDEMWIVLQGEGYIEYKDGTRFDYKPDAIIYNPADLPHKIVATGNVESVYYFVRFNA